MRTHRYSLFAALFLLLISFAHAQQPPAPTNLVAKVQRGEEGLSIVLSWRSMSMSEEPSFNVYRSVDDTSHFTLRDGESEGSFRDGHVSIGHDYYYFVREVYSQHETRYESGRSNIAHVSLGTGSQTSPGGVISGTVTDSVSGRALKGVQLSFFKVSSRQVWDAQAWSDSSGHYSASLDTGTYIIRAVALHPQSWGPMMGTFTTYVPEWFDDAADAQHATKVVLADSEKFVADFDLKPFVPPGLVTVQGTVTDTAGKGLRGASVIFTRTMQEMEGENGPGGDGTDMDEDMDVEGLGHWPGALWKGTTDSSGQYTANVFSGRSYTAFAFKQGYLPQFYKNAADPRGATTLVFSGDTSGIDFALTPKPVYQNNISGTIHDSAGNGVAGRIILIGTGTPHSYHNARFSLTDSTGKFTITNIPPGSYFVLAIPYFHFAPAFFKAGACGVRRWQMADTVQVSATSMLTGIGICVDPFAGEGVANLSGSVQSSGVPLTGANVFALNSAGDPVGYGASDVNGQFLIPSLPAGQTTVLADQIGYQYSETDVVVSPDQTTVANVNLSLAAIATSSDAPAFHPAAYALDQNYPNPFNPSTKISFEITEGGRVSLVVYDVLGREVATLLNERKEPGRYEVTWSAANVSSGVYFYRLTEGVNVLTRKLVVLR